MSIEGKTKAKRNRNSYGLESIIGNIKNGSNYGSVKGYAQLAYYIQQEMEKEEYTSQDLSSNLYLNGLKEESSPLMEYVNTADDEGLLFCCIDQCRKITFAKKPKGAFLWLGNSYFALGRVLHQRHPQEFNATTKERSQKVLDSTSSQRKELLEEIFRQARDCFEKACSENKGNATEYEVMIRMQGESSFWLYKHSHKLEDVANAKKCLRVVEDLGNSTIQNKEYLAITYLEMGKRSEHGFLKEALKRLDALQEQKKKERIRLRAEDFSYRGRCKLYLGRKGSPEYILGAIEDLKTSINLDRQEPHHYSLLADAYLCRARMISDQKPAGMWGMWARLKRQFIKDNALFSYLQEAKNNIEKAIEKAKNHGNVQTFHYCLEGLAADFAEWAGKQGFKVPCFEDQFHYWKEGMEIYLKKTAIEGSEHRIQGPEGEYDLLGNIFLLKKGTRAALEIEKKNTLIIASRLKKRDKKAGIKYFVPISLGN